MRCAPACDQNGSLCTRHQYTEAKKRGEFAVPRRGSSRAAISFGSGKLPSALSGRGRKSRGGGRSVASRENLISSLAVTYRGGASFPAHTFRRPSRSGPRATQTSKPERERS